MKDPFCLIFELQKKTPHPESPAAIMARQMMIKHATQFMEKNRWWHRFVPWRKYFVTSDVTEESVTLIRGYRVGKKTVITGRLTA
jgi:hypothetical protein